MSSEEAMRAARYMADASDKASRAAESVSDAARTLTHLFDQGYGGSVFQLIELLEKHDKHEVVSQELALAKQQLQELLDVAKRIDVLNDRLDVELAGDLRHVIRKLNAPTSVLENSKLGAVATVFNENQLLSAKCDELEVKLREADNDRVEANLNAMQHEENHRLANRVIAELLTSTKAVLDLPNQSGGHIHTPPTKEQRSQEMVAYLALRTAIAKAEGCS